MLQMVQFYQVGSAAYAMGELAKHDLCDTFVQL